MTAGQVWGGHELTDDASPYRRNGRQEAHPRSHRKDSPKLEERRRPLLLLLLAVNIKAWDVDVIQEFRVELCRSARREEHHDLMNVRGNGR